MRKATALILLLGVTFAVTLAPSLDAYAERLPSELTTFSTLAEQFGLRTSDPGFRLDSLEISMSFDPPGQRYTAEYSADLKLLGDHLPDIENWLFWAAEGVLEVTLGGVPVTVRSGIPFPGSSEYSAMSLDWGEAATQLTPNSPARLVIKTSGNIAPEIGADRYGCVVDLQGQLNELLPLCDPETTWLLRVTVPEGWAAICQGNRIETDSQQGEGTTTFSWIQTTNKSGINVPLIVGPYHRVDLGLPGDFGLWLLDEDKAAERELAQAVADVIKRANEAISREAGLPELTSLQVVKSSVPGKNMSGKGPLGMVLLECGRESRATRGMLLDTMTHEICHQWFPGQIQLDVSNGLWLSEGMATYFDARHLRNDWPPDEYFPGQGGYKPSAYSINRASATLGTLPGRDKQQVIYIRSAWVANMLRETIGDDAFRRTLQRFYTPSTSGLIGTPELKAIAEEESGQNLDQFFGEWLDKATIPSVSIDNVRLDRAAGGWLVKGTVTSKYPMPLPPVLVGIVQDGSLVETTTVNLPEVSGQTVQQTSFEIAAPSLLTTLVLDPDARILNIANTGRSIPLLLVWAKRPVVAVPGLLVLSAALVLAARGYGRRRRQRPLEEATAGEAMTAPGPQDTES